MKSPACRAVHVNGNFDFYALFSCHYHSSSIAFICIPSLHSIALKSIAYMRGPHPHGVDFKKMFGDVRCWSSSSLYMFSPHHFYLFHHPFRSTLFSLYLFMPSQCKPSGASTSWSQDWQLWTRRCNATNLEDLPIWAGYLPSHFIGCDCANLLDFLLMCLIYWYNIDTSIIGY